MTTPSPENVPVEFDAVLEAVHDTYGAQTRQLVTRVAMSEAVNRVLTRQVQESQAEAALARQELAAARAESAQLRDELLGNDAVLRERDAELADLRSTWTPPADGVEVRLPNGDTADETAVETAVVEPAKARQKNRAQTVPQS